MSLNRIRFGVCWLAPAFLASAGLLAGCAAAASADRTTAPATQIDTSKNGVYESGPWRYEFSVSSPGSKSEGYHGKLLYNGRVLPWPTGVNDYYQTPWGPMYWVGEPVVLWGNHGWMPSSLSREPAGQALPVPSNAGQGLVVYAEVLASGPLGTPDRLEKNAWVLTDLKGFGVKAGHVQQDWLHLGKESVTIHDTKRWGTAQMRLAETAVDKPLVVEIIGRGTLLVTPPKQDSAPADSTPPALGPKAAQTVELPRQAGATRLVKYALQGLPFDEALDLYLAFRVESLGRILVVGPEANGKTVAVKDVDTVVIQLPGDTAKDSVWSVRSVRGKAVEALGGMEYEEDAPNAFGVSLTGTFKAFFRVQQKGRATVALECRPLAEQTKAAGKSFKVTLNVQSTAAKSSGPQAAEPASGSRASRR
jgi:predicted secreted protein